MPKRKLPENVVTLDSFGTAKDYWMAFVKSPARHFSFANQIHQTVAKDCSYIGNLNLEDTGEIIAFPTYFLCFNEEYSVDLTIISNKVTAPHQFSSKLEDPLFGGLLFEDEYHLFNNIGLKKMTSSYSDIDYILMLSSDNSIDNEDFINILETSKKFTIIDSGTPDDISNKQKKSKQFIDFLQFLFYESENMVSDFKLKKKKKSLNNKMSLSEHNYRGLKYPVEDDRVITSAYIRRPDL